MAKRIDRRSASQDSAHRIMLDEAMALWQAGRLSEAERVYTKVLQRQPRSFDALHLLGIIALQTGRILRGAEFIAKAIKVDPGNADAHSNLGSALHDLKRPAEAVASYTRAISLNPNRVESHIDHGAALLDLKRYAEALESFDRAIALRPDYAEAYGNRGIVLRMLRRYDEALVSYDKGLLLAPNSAQMHCNRSNTLYELHRYGEALSGYDKALSLKPDLGDAMVGRGNVLADLQRYDEAFAAYDSALSLDPALENAWLGRANSLYDRARRQEAVSAYDKALALKPDLENAWLGRGNALYDLRRFVEALAAYDKAFALNPDLPSVEGARLNAKMMLCDWRNLDDECRHVVESVRRNRPCTAPFAFLAIPASVEDQFQCAKTWVDGKYPKSDGAHWSGKGRRHGKIRIGYVSSDLCEHATSYLMAGVFEHHDRSRFETTAFSVGPDDRSELRKRLERSFDGFHDVRSFTDDRIASEIATAEIDILVDLNGFTRNSRTAIFARRPAPIQASYLGYPGTMGAEFIDYIVGDPTTIPDADRNAYSEKIIYLPHSYQANDDARLISEKTFTRTECGLPPQGFVFCCFNNSYKIMPSTFDVWMRLLARIDDSVLWLFQDNETASNNLRREATARSINPDRLIFATRLPMSEHLARHRVADLFLDTLPYNAHTTASDALWAGLPVLTRIGETFAGRVASSLLKAIGLPELIAQTADDYERQAFELATQSGRLTDIRARLEANRLTTPLFDTRQFTRHIERAYEIVHERQQSGLAPEHIHFAN